MNYCSMKKRFILADLVVPAHPSLRLMQTRNTSIFDFKFATRTASRNSVYVYYYIPPLTRYITLRVTRIRIPVSVRRMFHATAVSSDDLGQGHLYDMSFRLQLTWPFHTIRGCSQSRMPHLMVAVFSMDSESTSWLLRICFVMEAGCAAWCFSFYLSSDVPRVDYATEHAQHEQYDRLRGSLTT